MMRLRYPLFAALALYGTIVTGVAQGDVPKVSASADKVKVTAVATKPDAEGKQTVTITLDIENGWHLYANPVNCEFLELEQVVVKIVAKEEAKVKVNYPAGMTRFAGRERYDTYERTVKVQATVARTKGDSSPLEIKIFMRPMSNVI